MVEYKRREVFDINLKVVKACVYDTLHKLYVVVVVGCQLVLYLIGQGYSLNNEVFEHMQQNNKIFLLRDGKILFLLFRVLTLTSSF